MHKEIWTFTKEELEAMKEQYVVKTAKEALERWVFANYDVRHTNGLDYFIWKNRVTIIEYDI